MSWIVFPLIFFLPFGITTPIDQFLQINSPPSLDGSAQEGANGGLSFQPASNYPSLVASNIDPNPSAYSYPYLQIRISLPRELTHAHPQTLQPGNIFGAAIFPGRKKRTTHRLWYSSRHLRRQRRPHTPEFANPSLGFREIYWLPAEGYCRSAGSYDVPDAVLQATATHLCHPREDALLLLSWWDHVRSLWVWLLSFLLSYLSPLFPPFSAVANSLTYLPSPRHKFFPLRGGEKSVGNKKQEKLLNITRIQIKNVIQNA